MTATIHYLNPPLREVPTQEIRSIYEDLYLEQVRKQNMERVMKDLHDKMHPAQEWEPQERTPDRELLLYGVFICGPASFLFGYLFHMITNG